MATTHRYLSPEAIQQRIKNTNCAWCGNAQRRWIGDNPATAIQKLKVRRGVPDALTVAQVEELIQYVAGWEDGKLVHYFALALCSGDAALEGGNTEGIIRRHYLNMASKDEGREFWKIAPCKGKKIINIA